MVSASWGHDCAKKLSPPGFGSYRALRPRGAYADSGPRRLCFVVFPIRHPNGPVSLLGLLLWGMQRSVKTAAG